MKRGPGGNGEIDIKLQDKDTNAMKKVLPYSFEYILDLERFWNDVVDEKEKANSNYWMYHLAK